MDVIPSSSWFVLELGVWCACMAYSIGGVPLRADIEFDISIKRCYFHLILRNTPEQFRVGYDFNGCRPLRLGLARFMSTDFLLLVFRLPPRPPSSLLSLSLSVHCCVNIASLLSYTDGQWWSTVIWVAQLGFWSMSSHCFWQILHSCFPLSRLRAARAIEPHVVLDDSGGWCHPAVHCFTH